MPDPKLMKLGKRAARLDSRTLKLGRYLTTQLPAPPQSVTYSKGVKEWGMFLNDQWGDCTIAGIAHAVQVWKLNVTGKMPVITDQNVIDYYSHWDGFDSSQTDLSGNNPTDQGGVELDVLNQWRKSDFLGWRLSAFADPSAKNLDHVRSAVYLFGGVYIGLALPLSAQDQKIWDTPVFKQAREALPGSWGGHCVFVCDYDSNERTFTCITWGGLQKMTYSFFRHYCDEVHALLSPEWLQEGKSLLGVDFSTLFGDLAKVTA